jgi:hypothetical protein
VFGHTGLYSSSSFLPLAVTSLGADALMTFGRVGLGLPYMYRSVTPACARSTRARGPRRPKAREPALSRSSFALSCGDGRVGRTVLATLLAEASVACSDQITPPCAV